MREFPTQRLSALLPLFPQAALHASIRVVLSGNCPGRVLVDCVDSPSVAVLDGPEGLYLGRLPGTDWRGVARHVSDWAYVYLPDDAPDALDALPHRYFVRHPRLRFLLEDSPARHVPRMRLPGTSVQLHDNGGVDIRIDKKTVAWCHIDCREAGHMEIGVGTEVAWRRKGLASLAASIVVERARAEGCTVGWHCHESNRASQVLAARLGFRLTGDYSAWSASLPAENPGDLVTDDLMRYAKCFHGGASELPWLRFHAAAAHAQLGELAMALQELSMLLDEAWQGPTAALTEHWAFAPLRTTSAFESLVARADGRMRDPDEISNE